MMNGLLFNVQEVKVFDQAFFSAAAVVAEMLRNAPICICTHSCFIELSGQIMRLSIAQGVPGQWTQKVTGLEKQTASPFVICRAT